MMVWQGAARMNPQKQKTELNMHDAAGQLILGYYNDVLYAKGLITKREYDLMSLRISQWRASSLPAP